jgi:hypothetical protein
MCTDEHEKEAAEIRDNKDNIRFLEMQGWKHYSNYINPDLHQKGREKLESQGKKCMTLEKAYDYPGRTIRDPSAVALWYRDKV